MTTRLLALAALFFFCFCLAEPGLAQTASPGLSQAPSRNVNLLLAQSGWPEYPSMGGEHEITRGAGGYLSWIKLLLIALVFLAWVKVADWLNRDALRFSEHTGMPADIWNPILVFSLVGGFIAVLVIPEFIAGYPLYVIAASLPFVIYIAQRRGRIPDDAKTGKLFSEDIAESAIPLKIVAAGASDDQSQANLILARQSPVFEQTCQLLHDSFRNRTEQILLDFTRESVTQRIQVDGIWHQTGVLDRESGDAMLWVIKTLAALNPAERKQTQRGQFRASAGREKVEFDVTSQGVKTGERVLVKILRTTSLMLELPNLGMSAGMIQTLTEKIDSAGMVIISGPPGQGLSSSWEGVLNGADRFTRDFVGVVDHDDRETERENVDCQRIDTRTGQSPATLLPKMILKQPSAFVMPVMDKATMDLMTGQIADENRTVITRCQANSAAEALLRVMAIAGERKQFVKGVTTVTCQRLVRKLCDSCKQPVQVNPQAIQQMGGDPNVQNTLYRDYQLPPPERRVDEEGKPVEMEPCSDCSGIGFVGRTAIYEMLLVDKPIRDVLQKSPKLELVSQIARKQGNLTLLQQAYRAVLEGRTSLSEVQRVFQVRK